MRNYYEISDKKELVSLRKRPTKGGGYSLLLDYTINGVRKREFLKMYLVPEVTKVDKIQNQETLKTAMALKAKRTIDIQNGEAGFNTKKSKTLLADYIDQRIAFYNKKGAISTAQSMKALKDRCREYKGETTTLAQVDKSYILGLIDYIANYKIVNKQKKTERLLLPGTQHRYFMMLSILLNTAYRDGLINENPCRRIEPSMKPKQPESTREFLTLEEVKKLIETPAEDDISKAAFLFACFTGLRISDIRELTWDEVIDETGGGRQIRFAQKKTKRPVNIPLSENAIRWMPEKAGKHVFENVPPPATLGRHLLDWAKAAGINKHITFHVARHTNATLLLTFGADIYTVSSLLGHTNVQTTRIYAKIVDEKKRKAVDLIPNI